MRKAHSLDMQAERHHRRVSARLIKIADRIETLRHTQRKCQSRILENETLASVNNAQTAYNACSVQIHELTNRADKLRKSLDPVDPKAEINSPCKRSGVKYCVGRLV